MTEKTEKELEQALRARGDGPNPLPYDRRLTDEQALYILGVALGTAKRIALSRSEAAEAIGVSIEFFDTHIAPELLWVRRGRRKLYPLGAVIWWFWAMGESDVQWRRTPSEETN